MWIDSRIANPLKEGHYKTLVAWDDFGNLQEESNELFNGSVWDLYESNAQFIHFWWAEKDDYKIITDKLEEERDKLNNVLQSIKQ